jgi:hypothetical protein
VAGENVVLQKAAAVTQATINTYLGATSAFAETPGGILTKSLAAAAAVAMGVANVHRILSQNTETPKNQAAERAKSTVKVKFHTGGVAGQSPDSKVKEQEITRTLLTTERVLSPKQTAIFDSMVSSISSRGGADSIIGGIGYGSSGTDMMYAAFSRALRDMKAPVMTWQEFERQEQRQARLKSNAMLK